MALDVLRLETDVVHAHAFGMPPTWMAAFARRVRTTPLVVETHFDAGRGTPGWWAYARAVAHFTLAPADRIVAHTDLETNLLASLGVRPERIAKIPNGIDLSEFVDFPSRTSSSEGLTLLFVGRLYPEQKGLEPLVRALATIPSHVGLRLRIVGEDWGGRALVVRLARELDVERHIALTGPLSRAELLKEYARADVFVLPSLFDCTPIVLLEAMADRATHRGLARRRDPGGGGRRRECVALFAQRPRRPRESPRTTGPGRRPAGEVRPGRVGAGGTVLVDPGSPSMDPSIRDGGRG